MSKQGFLKLNINNWKKLENLTTKDVPYKKKAVYVFKLDKKSIKEEDAILYIGSSNNLVRRIFGNYIGGPGGSTSIRIHNYLISGGYSSKILVGWKLTNNYREKEKSLIREYKRKFGRKPPWHK